MAETNIHGSRSVSEFKDSMNQLGDRAGEVKDNISGLAHDAMSAAKAGVNQATGDIKRTVDAGKKGAVHAMEDLSDRISENPLASVGIAAGVGMAIGLLLFRPRA
ncbi:MAG: DUF883 family protein [Planctomycetes bacterium]|nr:DUF883 family protein [Planctomycetota bacterium]